MDNKAVNSRRITSSLMIPILGILPIVSFLLLDFIYSYQFAVSAGLITYVLFFVVVVMILKYNIPYTFHATTFIFPLVILFSLIKPFSILYYNYSSIILEIFVVLVFQIFISVKGYFRRKILMQPGGDTEFKLIEFNSNIYVFRTVLFIMLLHLLMVLVYFLFPTQYHTVNLDHFIIYISLLIFIGLHFVYEFLHLTSLKKKYKREEWFPVIDETGNVRGKVASSISVNSGNKYLHPVVRIALIHKGRLFLKEKASLFDDAYKLDYPFERYVRFKESLDEAIKKTFIESKAPENLPYNYLFKYIHKNEQTNRLIYLYVSNVRDSDLLENVNLGNGKWWTSKQIEENLNTGVFSEYFEKEFDFINSTILMAEKMINDLN